MTYDQQTWVDNDPRYPLSAARLAHIEAGIAAAAAGGGGIGNPLIADLDGGGHNLLNFGDVTVTGLPGATQATRWAGGTTSGAPSSGSFNAGDVTFAYDGGQFIRNPGGFFVPVGGGPPWRSPSPLGTSYRPSVQLLMSSYDTNPASSDQTTAIQNALSDALAIIVAGVCHVDIIFDSRLVYTIGASVTSGSHNEWSQIHWPWSHSVVGCINLRGMPTGTGFIYSQGQNGTVIQSSLTSAPSFSGTTGIASMIGGPSSYRSSPYDVAHKTLINMGIYDLTFRSGSSGPVIAGVDAGGIMGVAFDNIGFDTPQTATNGALFNARTMNVYTGSQGVPIIFPQVNNFFGTKGGMLLVENWPTGPVLGEQTLIDTVAVALCPGAAVNQDAVYHTSRINSLIDVDVAYGVANHDPSSGSYVTSMTGNSLTTPGTNTTVNPVTVGSWAVQWNNSEGPDAMNRVYDVYDSSSNAVVVGTIGVVNAGVGAVTSGGLQLKLAGGCGRVRVKDRYAATGPKTAPAVPSSTVAIYNPFAADAFIQVTGGAFTQVVISGTNMGTGGNYMLPANGTISVTYTVAPTWAWTLL